MYSALAFSDDADDVAQARCRFGPPDNEAPSTVGVSGVIWRSADVAILLVGLTRYTTGLQIELAIRRRLDPDARRSHALVRRRRLAGRSGTPGWPCGRRLAQRLEQLASGTPAGAHPSERGWWRPRVVEHSVVDPSAAARGPGARRRQPGSRRGRGELHRGRRSASSCGRQGRGLVAARAGSGSAGDPPAQARRSFPGAGSSGCSQRSRPTSLADAAAALVTASDPVSPRAPATLRLPRSLVARRVRSLFSSRFDSSPESGSDSSPESGSAGTRVGVDLE